MSAPKLRVLLVTCDITHVPNNYLEFLETLEARCPGRIVGVVVLRFVSPYILLSLPFIALAGAPRVAATMFKNVLSYWRGDKSRFFGTRNIPVRTMDTMNSPEALAWIRELNIDLVVNARTMCFYKAEILKAPRLGCWNIHHGLLPEERGMLCDVHALANDASAGFSIHRMTPKLDDGEILKTRVVSNPGEKDYLAHARRSSIAEAEELAGLILETERLGQVPAGEKNVSAHVVNRKAPQGLGDVLALTRKGLRI